MKRILFLLIVSFMLIGPAQAFPPMAPNTTYTPVVVTHAATESVTAATMYGGLHVCTGAYTLSLPAAVAGMSGLFAATTAAAMTLDPNGTQVIIHDRASLGAGVTLVSDGVAYAVVYLECVVTGYWIAYVNMGTFAAGS